MPNLREKIQARDRVYCEIVQQIQQLPNLDHQVLYWQQQIETGFESILSLTLDDEQKPCLLIELCYVPKSSRWALTSAIDRLNQIATKSGKWHGCLFSDFYDTGEYQVPIQLDYGEAESDSILFFLRQHFYTLREENRIKDEDAVHRKIQQLVEAFDQRYQDITIPSQPGEPITMMLPQETCPCFGNHMRGIFFPLLKSSLKQAFGLSVMELYYINSGLVVVLDTFV